MIARERRMDMAAVCGVGALLMCCSVPVRQVDARGRPRGRVSADSIHRMALGTLPPSVIRQRAHTDSIVRAKARADSLWRRALADSFPDVPSYPGTSLHDMSEAETRVMDDLLGTKPFIHRQWWESQRHPFLESVLPKVRFFRMDEADSRVCDGGPGANYLSLRNGKLYHLARINYLLLDAGFTFDSTQRPTIVKLVALFATFGKQPQDTGRRPWDTPPPPTRGFPAITFLSVRRGEWQPPHLNAANLRRGWHVDCLLDGQRTQLFVTYRGPEPEEVWVRDGRFLMELPWAPRRR
jgi:hypothetical protein